MQGGHVWVTWLFIRSDEVLALFFSQALIDLGLNELSCAG